MNKLLAALAVLFLMTACQSSRSSHTKYLGPAYIPAQSTGWVEPRSSYGSTKTYSNPTATNYWPVRPVYNPSTWQPSTVVRPVRSNTSGYNPNTWKTYNSLGNTTWLPTRSTFSNGTVYTVPTSNRISPPLLIGPVYGTVNVYP